MKKQPARKKKSIDADPEKKYIDSERYADDDEDEQEIEPTEFNDDDIVEWPEEDDDH